MLAIHVVNHSSDKIVPPRHISYFINGDGRKLRTYLSHSLHFRLNFFVRTLKNKNDYLPNK